MGGSNAISQLLKCSEICDPSELEQNELKGSGIFVEPARPRDSRGHPRQEPTGWHQRGAPLAPVRNSKGVGSRFLMLGSEINKWRVSGAWLCYLDHLARLLVRAGM